MRGIISYSLRLWIDSNVEDETLIKNKSLSYKLAVEATQEIAVSYVGMMKAREFREEYMSGGMYETFDTDFFVYKDSITAIAFENKIAIPADISSDKKWDMSVKQDGSVMAYLEDIGDS